MELGGTNALDNLASNGIIDFDADSYVRGTPPKYVGSPSAPACLPFEKPLMAEPSFMPPVGTRLSGQPAKDEFGHHNKKHILNWKQALTGVIVAGLLVLGGIKAADSLGKFSKWLKKKPAATGAKSGFFSKIKTTVTGWFSKKKPVVTGPKTGFFSKMKSTVTGWFGKKKPNGATAADVVKKAATKFPKWAKITAGISAGLLGLYGLFKMTSGGRTSNARVMQGVPTQTMALAKEPEQAAAQANVAQPQAITPTTAVEPQSALMAQTSTNANEMNQNQSIPQAIVEPQQLAMAPAESQPLAMAPAQPSAMPQYQQATQAEPQQPVSAQQPTVSVAPQQELPPVQQQQQMPPVQPQQA